MGTVLVIGASRGIGLEFARQYAEAGERVIATARDDAGLERLRALGAEARRLDVADPASISGLAWSIVSWPLRSASCATAARCVELVPSDTTSKYEHLTPDYLADAMAAIDRYFDALRQHLRGDLLPMATLHATVALTAAPSANPS